VLNYHQLASELASQGTTIPYDYSDTDIFYLGLVHNGREFLNSIDGFFTVCFTDKTANKGFIARDKVGQKPFFIASKRAC